MKRYTQRANEMDGDEYLVRTSAHGAHGEDTEEGKRGDGEWAAAHPGVVRRLVSEEPGEVISMVCMMLW